MHNLLVSILATMVFISTAQASLQKNKKPSPNASAKPSRASRGFPITLLSAECGKFTTQGKSYTAITVQNTDPKRRSTWSIEWEVWVFDFEISKDKPVDHFYAQSVQALGPGDEGRATYSPRKYFNPDGKNTVVRIIRVEFADGSEWKTSPNDKKGITKGCECP